MRLPSAPCDYAFRGTPSRSRYPSRELRARLPTRPGLLLRTNGDSLTAVGGRAVARPGDCESCRRPGRHARRRFRSKSGSITATDRDAGSCCRRRPRVWAEPASRTDDALAFVPNQARDGRRAGRSHCVSERKRRPCPVWGSLSGPSKRVGVGQRSEHPVRRGADDSDGGVSPTHRGRARSARRSRASRTSWSRRSRAERAW
jgi:hypothetical protein